MVKLNDLAAPANEMAKVYEEHSTQIKVSAPDGSFVTESYVTDIGMKKLGDIFGSVPIGHRPGVYSIFLDKLNELGLDANIEQFKGSVH